MPIAALYDIHGNLPALEAVLADARAAGADRLVVGGDVLPGPMPGECLDLLANSGLPLTSILGNGEVAVLAERAGRDSGVPAAYRAAMRWVASQLTDTHAHAIAAWPKTAMIDLDGCGRTLFCHATPRNENDIFTKDTPVATLVPLFEAAGAPLVVCGHTHMPFDRRIGGVRVVNAGSVGMPFGQSDACWLLIGDTLELRRTAYDREKAAARIRATAYPGAEAFAAQYVLDTPSEAVMLASYARAQMS